MRAVLYNRILIGLGLIGVFISGSLSIAKFQHKQLPCGLQGSCQAVSEHPTAYWFGIPVAYFGLAGYVVLALLAILREVTGRETSRALVLPGYLMAVFGFFASAYLQYTSFAIIHEKCTWCISSALAMLITLGVYTALYSSLDESIPSARGPRTRSWPAVVALLILTVGVTIGMPAMFGSQDKIKAAVISEGGQLIPSPRNELGPQTAPVTVVEFADFCCPTCRNTAAKTRALVDKYPGKVRLIFRHFPLFQVPGHEMAYPAAIASEFAAEKGKFWEFHKRIMSLPQPVAKTDEILSVAGSIGLDELALGKIIGDANSPEGQRVYRDFNDGLKVGVTGTPSFYVVIAGRSPLKVSFEAIDSEFESGELAKYVH